MDMKDRKFWAIVGSPQETRSAISFANKYDRTAWAMANSKKTIKSATKAVALALVQDGLVELGGHHKPGVSSALRCTLSSYGLSQAAKMLEQEPAYIAKPKQRGRPRLPSDSVKVVFSLRISEANARKLRALGVGWLEGKLDEVGGQETKAFGLNFRKRFVK